MNDFDDVYILPQYSNIERGDVDLSGNIFNIPLSVPVLSSPMDTVSKLPMLKALIEEKCLGVHHRYCSLATLLEASEYGAIAVSPSIPLDFLEKYSMDYNIAVLDVAHGHTRRNLDYSFELVKMGWNVISGNIVTRDAAEDYLKLGIKHLRVGIGSGSVCTTRLVTGVGRPQYKAIREIHSEFKNDALIISDGGHRNTGDIAKAFALGASYVMLGRMLASTREAENDGIYSGMASSAALRRNRKTEFFVEGKSEIIYVNQTVHEVITEIKAALETTCYYSGVKTLKGLAGNFELCSDPLKNIPWS